MRKKKVIVQLLAKGREFLPSLTLNLLFITTTPHMPSTTAYKYAHKRMCCKKKPV